MVLSHLRQGIEGKHDSIKHVPDKSIQGKLYIMLTTFQKERRTNTPLESLQLQTSTKRLRPLLPQRTPSRYLPRSRSPIGNISRLDRQGGKTNGGSRSSAQHKKQWKTWGNSTSLCHGCGRKKQHEKLPKSEPCMEKLAGVAAKVPPTSPFAFSRAERGFHLFQERLSKVYVPALEMEVWGTRGQSVHGRSRGASGGVHLKIIPNTWVRRNTSPRHHKLQKWKRRFSSVFPGTEAYPENKLAYKLQDGACVMHPP